MAVTPLKRVGFVATGDELVNGDILNTNTPYLCQQLLQQNIVPGQHLVVGDDETEICQAIEYLQPNHSAIITIGGLGPTADDRTRYALAQATQQPLDFYPEAWQWIVKKITSLGYTNIPETNRQQAFLPKGSKALHNTQGTAAACYLQHAENHYFMLPGPPHECYSIFNNHVLPTLLALDFPIQIYRRTWLLLGVSEGQIASELEPLLKGFPDCQLSYRIDYPYLEIKLTSKNKSALTPLASKLKNHFSQNVISEQRQTASEQLRTYLFQNKCKIMLEDTATEGALLQRLISPKTYAFLRSPEPDFNIKISGFDNYWQHTQDDPRNCQITIKLSFHGKTKDVELNIPYRGPHTLINAVEKIAWEILEFTKMVRL